MVDCLSTIVHFPLSVTKHWNSFLLVSRPMTDWNLSEDDWVWIGGIYLEAATLLNILVAERLSVRSAGLDGIDQNQPWRIDMVY